MISFIKDYSLVSIKTKLKIIYALNVFDIVATILLYNTGLFLEVNSFMELFLENPLIAISIKVILPGALFLIMFKHMHDATEKQLKISNVALQILMLYYGIIALSHILWTLLIPFLSNFII